MKNISKKLALAAAVVTPTLMGIAIAAPEPWPSDLGKKPVPYTLSTTAAPVGGIIPLFDKSTKLETALTEDRPDAIVTRFADRVRDRHARENMFHAYNHFIALYWENRTVSFEIIDKVAKGGKTVTYNMTSLFKLNKPNLRLFFEGKGTVAQYMNNSISKEVDSLHYTLTVEYNNQEKRPLKVGDRIETEFSPFLQPPVTGRTNYYGTAFLYVVGTPGMAPWEGRGKSRDSFPIPAKALLGGNMTVHEPNSDEPKEIYKQMGTNIAPINAQPFVLGRRVFHTDFGTGNHTEPGNPAFTSLAGKLGPRFAEKACISCHINDSRALVPKTGEMITKYAVHVGTDEKGTPHPDLGYILQPRSTEGASEGSVTLSGWDTIKGTYGDGTAFELRKPQYTFKGVTPKFYSVRIAPQLVGMGQMEAIDEKEIVALAMKTDKPDGIKGKIQKVTDPETGKLRLGRFGYKGGQATLKQQIASAFANDMGVTNEIYPNQDQGSNQPKVAGGIKVPSTELDDTYRYVATLGVNPRRNYEDDKGEKLFAAANCVTCHTDTMKTSAYHPFAELRNQTVKPYSDMLLHDMGKGLADNMGEGEATGAEWRTAPLWGLGYTAGASGGEGYLHDGRARTIEEAILWHGGEAEKSKERFRNMSKDDRDAIVKFIKSL